MTFHCGDFLIAIARGQRVAAATTALYRDQLIESAGATPLPIEDNHVEHQDADDHHDCSICWVA
jgi:hypothetical protein